MPQGARRAAARRPRGLARGRADEPAGAGEAQADPRFARYIALRARAGQGPAMLGRMLLSLILFAGLTGWTPGPRARPPLVLAAASLQESMTAAANAWAAKGHARPVISFAAS